MSTGETKQRQIWKYKLSIVDGPQRVHMPIGARIVHVAEQDGDVCFWAQVYPDLVRVPRDFFVHGTGHPIPGDEEYVAQRLCLRSSGT